MYEIIHKTSRNFPFPDWFNEDFVANACECFTECQIEKLGSEEVLTPLIYYDYMQ